jgi:hypothetical protein
MSQTTRQTLEMPNVLTARITRGLTSVTTQEWVVQKEDPENVLRRQLGVWLQDVSANNALFKKHVYDNDDLGESDLRQHRGRICELISLGELLAMGFTAFGQETGKEKEVLPVVETIDQVLKKLFDVLMAWHGPLAAQTDIPESFKQAAREVEEGKVVDLDI